MSGRIAVARLDNSSLPDTKILFQGSVFTVCSRLFGAFCNRFLDYLRTSRSSPFEIISNVSTNTVQTFLDACQMREYEITPSNATDLLVLARDLGADSIAQDIELFISDPSISHDLLLPAIQSLTRRGQATGELEARLRSDFLDYLEDPLLFQLPPNLLRRVIDFPSRNGPALRAVFRFVLHYIDRIGKSGGLLLSGLDLTQLDSEDFESLRCRSDSLLYFISDSPGRTMISTIERLRRLEEAASPQGVFEVLHNAFESNLSSLSRRCEENAQRLSSLNLNHNQLEGQVSANHRDISELAERLSLIERDWSTVKSLLLNGRDLTSAGRRISDAINHVRTSEIPFQEEHPLNGIVSYLSKQCGGNVSDMNIVTITCDLPFPAADRRPAEIADLEGPSYFCSASVPQGDRASIRHEPNHWVCYDFRKMRIRPSHYSIRSKVAGLTNGSNLKSWMIEISGPEGDWIEVDRHENNDDLNGGNRIKTFAIASAEMCHRIRLRQIGKNHLGGDQLVLSAFEIFGTLIEPA
jgi:hypothetical protein